jgi:predicted DNA-binding protein
MVFKNNQANNTNKPENSKKQESIIKKIGKKENYYVNESTNKYIKEGDEIVMSKFTYSGRIPKQDIIGEILKRLEKMDLKLDFQGEEIKKINTKIDNIDTRLVKLENKVDNIELVQKLQGEEIKEIKEVQKLQGEKITNIEQVQKMQGEKLDKLEIKLDNVIFLNNLKTE